MGEKEHAGTGVALHQGQSDVNVLEAMAVRHPETGQ